MKTNGPLPVAFVLLVLSPPVFGAGPIEAGWRADQIVSSTNQQVRLLGSNKKIVATVDRLQIEQLSHILRRVENVAGLYSEFWVVKTNDDKPNAFATSSNGKNMVAISTSMLRLLGQNMEAYAALFGHEIAHNVKKHGAQTQSRQSLGGFKFQVQQLDPV